MESKLNRPPDQQEQREGYLQSERLKKEHLGKKLLTPYYQEFGRKNQKLSKLIPDAKKLAEDAQGLSNEIEQMLY